MHESDIFMENHNSFAVVSMKEYAEDPMKDCGKDPASCHHLQAYS